ncbi:MAG TPA: hypothetical protein VF885_05015 [Arthrobacter sp.]
MTSNDKPSAEDLRFLESQGMVEVEPGRWVGAPELQLPGAGDTRDGLSVFVAVKPTSADAFAALDPAVIEDSLNRAADQYPNMLAPDLMAVTLRKLGIKCKAIETNPAEAGPGGPDPRDFPGFLAVLIEFPGARRIWLDS